MLGEIGDREPIAVDHDYEVAEFLRAGEEKRLPDRSLVTLSVPDDAVDAIIFSGNLGAIRLSAGESDPDPERAARKVDPGDAGFGMDADFAPVFEEARVRIEKTEAVRKAANKSS